MGNGFEDLNVWQKSRDLVKVVYEVTAGFPDSERYGLTSQIRRAAVSISSNIAEGSARGTDKNFARFLLMAVGSSAEVKCQLILANDLGYIGQETLDKTLSLIHEIGKMLKGLRKSILAKQGVPA